MKEKLTSNRGRAAVVFIADKKCGLFSECVQVEERVLFTIKWELK